MREIELCGGTKVSIHTPIQGVTLAPLARYNTMIVSIHTPIQGVTAFCLMDVLTDVFQSTHPYRVWHQFGLVGSLLYCFNPHTHTGCDLRRSLERRTRTGFNPHTHTGCDDVQICVITLIAVSIHTPIQGVTESFCNNLLTPGFQSTHPYRVWPHIQQKAEYHDAKIDILRKTTK